MEDTANGATTLQVRVTDAEAAEAQLLRLVLDDAQTTVIEFGRTKQNLIPQAALLALPWTLSQSAVGLALGSALPAVWPIPVVATALWIVLFVGLGLWRFGREEF